MGSILNETKKALGLDPEYTPFDQELIMHINGTLATLNQLGIGPELGFMITDATPTWETFLGNDPRLNGAMQYMFIDVKLRFDPPTVGYVLTSWEKLRDEAAWRLNVAREEIVHPHVDDVPEEDLVLDAGEI